MILVGQWMYGCYCTWSCARVLGSVGKPDPETDASEQDNGKEAAWRFVIPCGNAPPLLEMADKALDA
jgi:hypothetical protein